MVTTRCPVFLLLYRVRSGQFPNQIESEYHDVNRSVYIEGNSLETFTSPQYRRKLLALDNFSSRVVFYSFFSDNCKQDSDATSSHIKCLIKIFKNRKFIFLV